MFKTNKTNKGFIITIISIAVCFIVFLILKITIRGDMNTASGGELLIPMIPLIVYLFLKNWELFSKTCFWKDTSFDDYFDEYFSGKDMIEDTSSIISDFIDLDDFITK